MPPINIFDLIGMPSYGSGSDDFIPTPMNVPAYVPSPAATYGNTYGSAYSEAGRGVLDVLGGLAGLIPPPAPPAPGSPNWTRAQANAAATRPATSSSAAPTARPNSVADFEALDRGLGANFTNTPSISTATIAALQQGQQAGAPRTPADAEIIAGMQPGMVRQLSDGRIISMDATGRLSVENAPKVPGVGGGGGGGGASLGYGNALTVDDQIRLFNETQGANSTLLAELSSKTQSAVEQIRKESAERAAQIAADASLGVADKQAAARRIEAETNERIANINKASAAEVQGLENQIREMEATLKSETDRHIADRDYDKAIAGLEAQKMIEAEKAGLERYKADLQYQLGEKTLTTNLATTAMTLQSEERQTRQKAAVDFFGQLAQLAPQQNLVNAYFSLRGQAPPQSMAEQAMQQMAPILGMGSEQTNAIIQGSGIQNQTFAPFLNDILGLAAPAAAAR